MALHRQIAAERLGRSLLPGEIVHHRDGDSTNNTPENLLVLPSQRFHAHIEYHLRCEKRGMPFLFPELLQGVQEERPGTLWGGILPQ
ncbi:HNH endonuclease [Deinococcus metallilatus]|uniref:HNH endonuclease n=1 Tax=Deinococcus metallilatus TaxID=1211322 RepID=UPI0020177FF1|nr:HNH endonuclease [Deinococcus metallilatus]